jgi:hypothetical protein
MHDDLRKEIFVQESKKCMHQSRRCISLNPHHHSIEIDSTEVRKLNGFGICIPLDWREFTFQGYSFYFLSEALSVDL